jgi:hypothetical protein
LAISTEYSKNQEQEKPNIKKNMASFLKNKIIAVKKRVMAIDHTKISGLWKTDIPAKIPATTKAKIKNNFKKILGLIILCQFLAIEYPIKVAKIQKNIFSGKKLP